MNITKKRARLMGGFALVLLVNVSSSPSYAESSVPTPAHQDSPTLHSPLSATTEVNQQRLLLQNSSKRPAQCYDSGLC